MDPSSDSGPPHPGAMRGTWAKRTGFKSNLSGESISDADTKDLEMGSKGLEAHQPKVADPPGSLPNPNPSPIPNPTPNLPTKQEQSSKERTGKAPENLLKPPIAPHQATPPKSTAKGVKKEGHHKRYNNATCSNDTTTTTNNNNSNNRAQDSSSNAVENGNRHQPIRIKPTAEGVKGSTDADAASLSQDSDDDHTAKHSHVKYEIRETPRYGSLVVYGIQHFVSIIGSLVLIPLVIVPAMGGDDKDTAYVVSTVLFVSGISTLLHSSFGSRLPLIQGASFVYLAPALAIINSSDFASIGNNRFKETMRELQGSILVASIFQMFLGYSGLMAVLLRLINPVVVAPTVAAVGLSFFTYGIPVVGTCIEIGVPQIVIIIFFALYLRKISIMGHRIFQVYAVPLGLAITWAYAFILTAIGNYDFKGCDFSIPSSNILSESCQAHAFTMKHCRTDTFRAFKTSAWIRFPYPLQWGAPKFHYKSAIVMIVVSIIASVDSVGTYHASALLVASGAPTAGVVSRGIGLEGVTSALASLWGIGTGCSTLTENVHTIAVTKMGSRRAVEFGACVLIILSFIGKVGAFIASIPQVIVAGLLCVMWAMLAALGLSNLRYSETGSSRNVVIVGLALFFSLSVPTFFQDYGVSPDYVATTSSYLQPYTVASHGPFNTSSVGLNFILNTLLSMNMVIAFFVAFILDNTVPGSKQERGVYVWLNRKGATDEPAVVMDYGLPLGLGRCFRWFKWVGL